jgi:peptidoglycan/LPS O-acetylase OafA/YrhL
VLFNPDHLSVVNSDVLGAFWLNALKFNPLARLPEFLLGMACGFLFLRSRRESKLALPMVLSGMVALIVVVYFSAVIPYPILHTALLGPAFAAIVYGFALRPNWGAILENRLLVLCGDASYSLYLLHSMIIGMYFHSTTGQLRYQSPIGVLVFVLLAVTVSALVYRFIEEPARRKLNPKRKAQLGPAGTQPPPQAVPA